MKNFALVILFCTYVSLAEKVQEELKMEQIQTSTINVNALGRVANLGDFYDARKEQFIGISLYTQQMSSGAVQSTSNAHANIDYVAEESFSEKMDKLRVSASLRLSVLGELVSATGSGKYLQNNKKSSKSATASLVYHLRTVRDDLRMFYQSAQKNIDNDLIQRVDATHVVVGIEWGSDVVLSLEETSTDESDKKEVQGKLKKALQLAVLSFSAGAKVDWGQQEITNSEHFNLDLEADIIPDKIPQTIQDAVTFIKNLPNLIKKENGGKGKIMNFIMMPLETIQKVRKVANAKPPIFNEVSQNLTDQFVDIFQEMKDSELQINDYYNEMKKWAHMISEYDFAKVTDLMRGFSEFSNNQTAQFANYLVTYRHGSDENNLVNLQNMINDYRSCNWTLQSVNQELNTFIAATRRIRLMTMLQNYRVSFLNRKVDKFTILTKNFEKKIKIFSMDLSMDVASPYMPRIVRLLQIEKSLNRTSYIEDVNIKIPEVNVYLSGSIISSLPINAKKEYVILISECANVIIFDVATFDQKSNRVVPELKYKSIAVVKNTFYSIDTFNGKISSTNIEDIMNGAKTKMNWAIVGSFPPTNHYTRSNAAVDGTYFYFLTFNNILYKYDTMLKTLANIGEVGGYSYFSSVFLNKKLFFFSGGDFYDYLLPSGPLEKKTDSNRSFLPWAMRYPGLFVYDDKVCVAGGTYGRDPKPVICYNATGFSESRLSSTPNEARLYPAVIATKAGTLFVGGAAKISPNNTDPDTDLKTIEIFDPNTQIWSYIPSPPAMTAGKYLGVSLFY